jgi:hypothetical protein
MKNLILAALVALPAALATTVAVAPAAAQTIDPTTGALSPQPPPIPFSSITCQPGQVLNAFGESCLPAPTLPQIHPSLAGSIPTDLTVGPAPLTPFFFNGTNCFSGQVLESNGESCASDNLTLPR